MAFYLPDERRWVSSFPQQHHRRGLKKNKATSQRFARTVRMLKAARNRLVEKKVLAKDDAPSYFIECLIYNVPDALFEPKLAPTYTGIVGWLKTAKLDGFPCQSGQTALCGQGREQWTQKNARSLVGALQALWESGGWT